MSGRWLKPALVLSVVPVFAWLAGTLPSQETRVEVVAATEPPPVPKGLDVLARGPVHEAYASLTADPVPTKAVPKKPPAPLEEMPPEEKPEGDVIWIGGYWAWDDDRSDLDRKSVV